MEIINEIEIPKGVDRVSVKQHDDRIVIEFIHEESKFKEGDFVYEDGRIMIVKNYHDNYYAIIYPKLGMKPIYNGSYAPTMTLSSLSFRYATEDEKQLLIDAMEKDGKRWDAEKLIVEDIPQPKFKIGDKVRIKKGISSKTHRSIFPGFMREMDDYIGQKFVIKNALWYTKGVYLYSVDKNLYSFLEDWFEPYIEELKKGDLAIFWGDNNLNPTIRLYHVKSHNGHSDNFGTVWGNAVKWDGTKEQFEKIIEMK